VTGTSKPKSAVMLVQINHSDGSIHRLKCFSRRKVLKQTSSGFFGFFFNLIDHFFIEKKDHKQNHALIER
jgi:hypothetical protein